MEQDAHTGSEDQDGKRQADTLQSGVQALAFRGYIVQRVFLDVCSRDGVF